MADDELFEIDGIKPKVFLSQGETCQAESSSTSTTYTMKRTMDHYYCECIAWKMAGGPVNARTCKHLKQLLGEKYEMARLNLKDPEGQANKAKGKAKASNAKKPARSGKRKRNDAEDEDDDEEEKPKPKKRSKKKSEDEDEDEDEKEDEDDDDTKIEVLLANKWDLETGIDPTGWWMSEKLDGVRVFYDGKQMLSRTGNLFTPPQWFLDKLPKDVSLDGELFGGRQNFQDTVSVVKTMNSPHWKTIIFQIFDIPSETTAPFEERVESLKKLFASNGQYADPQLVVIEHTKVKNREHVLETLKEVEKLGGEGLMLRKPGSLYVGKRSGTLLKVKTFHDAEARVVGYTNGKGKHAGSTGALLCEMQSGKKFKVGTGLSDKQRRNPPKIGTIITYRFQELTRDGVPRFPSFVGECIDKTKPKDASIGKAAASSSKADPKKDNEDDAAPSDRKDEDEDEENADDAPASSNLRRSTRANTRSKSASSMGRGRGNGRGGGRGRGRGKGQDK